MTATVMRAQKTKTQTGARLEDFDYDLPPELVAQTPAKERADSRLMIINADGGGGAETILRMRDFPKLLRAGDLLVVNNSRVLPARLVGEKTPGGARAELLAERFFPGGEMLAMIRCGGKLNPGAKLFAGGEFVVVAREGEFFRLRALNKKGKTTDARRRFLRRGLPPLPPYIRRAPDGGDGVRYQTVYAHGGAHSSAAPTAGLHFSDALMRAMQNRGARIANITLHIGAGTFKPLRRETLCENRLHSERYCINKKTAAAVCAAKKKGARVIAVGTTSLRALESSALRSGGEVCAGSGETDLFARPGFVFRVVDLLLTNFHPPRSSPLVLACAFAGRARVLSAYQFAARKQMRFYSYGDATLLARANCDL